MSDPADPALEKIVADYHTRRPLEPKRTLKNEIEDIRYATNYALNLHESEDSRSARHAETQALLGKILSAVNSLIWIGAMIVGALAWLAWKG